MPATAGMQAGSLRYAKDKRRKAARMILDALLGVVFFGAIVCVLSIPWMIRAERDHH